MHDFRTALLQLLDDLHARQQALLLALEPVDFGDALFQLGDLVGQSLVARLLVRDHLRVGKDRCYDNRYGRDDGTGGGDTELALTALALFLAPWE